MLKRINPVSIGIVAIFIAFAIVGVALDATSVDAYDELTGSVEADALTSCVEATPMVTIQVTNGYNFAITASVGDSERIIEAGESQTFELAFDGPSLTAGNTDVSITYGGDGFGVTVIRVDYIAIDCSQSTTTTTEAPTATTVPVAPVKLGPGGAVAYNDEPLPVAVDPREDVTPEGLAICG